MFNYFRTPLPDNAPVDPDSANIVARLAWEMPRLSDTSVLGVSPGHRSAPSWGPKLTPRCPIYKVPAGAPTTPVSSDRDDAEYTRFLLSNQGVPVPSGAVVAQPGDYNDRIMSIWSPAEDKLWDCYKMGHFMNDMTVYPAGCIAQSGGTLTASTAYFYRVTAVKAGVGETGIDTVGATGTPTKVGTVITTSVNKKARLQIWPRYMIDSVNVYRCVATNGSTLPGAPTGSPPDGQAYFYHRLSTTGILYRWNGTAWVNLNALYPYSPGYSDYGLIANLTPVTYPTLFAINGVLTSFIDTGLSVNQAVSPPVVSTLIEDDSTWRSWYVGSLFNISACPGHAQDIASGAGSPQERGWASSATGVPSLAGLVNKRDFERGEIDHAMTMAVHALGNNSATPPYGSWVDQTRYAYPAQNFEPQFPGNTITSQMAAAGCPAGSRGIPEGARFRLPASFDLNTIYSSAAYIALTTPQKTFCRMFAEAMQRYGIITSDTTYGVNIHCAWPSTEDPTDPNIALYGSPNTPPGPDEEYDGRNGTNWRPGWASEYAALKPRVGPATPGPFPWDALEVVRMGWAVGLPVGQATTPCTNKSIPCPLGGQ